jgi:hypothetical protein
MKQGSFPGLGAERTIDVSLVPGRCTAKQPVSQVQTTYNVSFRQVALIALKLRFMQNVVARDTWNTRT